MKKPIHTITLTCFLINPIFTSSCNCDIGEQYSDLYCDNWYQNLESDPDDLWYTHSEQRIEKLYPASAVNLFTYYPGWNQWNSLLHENKGEIPSNICDNFVNDSIGLPSVDDPFNLKKAVKYDICFKLGDYKVLENTLNQCKCGKITTYHGMEDQETELLNQINQILGLNDDYHLWEDIKNKEILRNQDLNKLIGKTLDYDGFCATSLSYKIGWDFIYNTTFGSRFLNSIFYEIDVDENTNGAYVSSKKHLFNKIPLGWPHEKQLLLSSKLKLKVTSASWYNSKGIKNILIIKCKGYHELNNSQIV